MGSLLQTDAWAEFKAKYGWHPERVGGYLGLTKQIFANKTMRYFPELPDTSAVIRLVTSNMPPSSNIFTRFEILESISDEKISQLRGLGLKKSFEEVQPEHRALVDLTKDEETILAQFHQKGRYSIKVAQRSELEIRSGREYLDEFVSLYSQTASRNSFSGRRRQYFCDLLQMLYENDLGELMIAFHHNTALAGIIVSYYEDTSLYLYGASSKLGREKMPTYLLQWEAIKRAKQRGCRVYDLLAISPPNVKIHRYDGITRFKLRFSSHRAELLGSWDLIHRRGWYTLYRLAQKIRRRI